MNLSQFSKLRLNLDVVAKPVQHQTQFVDRGLNDLKLAQDLLKRFMLPKKSS